MLEPSAILIFTGLDAGVDTTALTMIITFSMPTITTKYGNTSLKIKHNNRNYNTSKHDFLKAGVIAGILILSDLSYSGKVW